jgi:predicted AlkP superfamily pyrophosphatase or phosphodiesterase
MINQHTLSRFEPLDGSRLVKPIYADYSFGNIPNTIEYLLTGNRHGPLLPPDCFGGAYPRPKRIVTFSVDSFGWQFWQQYHGRYAATSRVVKEGTLTPISTLFPSTTAASVSTMTVMSIFEGS